MNERNSYRDLSKGFIKVYGNSAEIKEEFFFISRSQKLKLLREKVLDTFKNLERRSIEYDKRFEEHVLKYGHDFEKYYFPSYYKETVKKTLLEVVPEEGESEEEETPAPPMRKKGDISKFSKKSRLRLLRKLNQTNPDETTNVFHITLTYPKKFPEDGVTHKADLDAFIKRIKRKYSDKIEYLWKLEFQKRGAPHYHVILYLPKSYNLKYLRYWFSKNWYEVAQRFWDVKLENHRKAGVSCDKVNSLRLAGSYLSKYISKEEENTPENQGRFWGCSRNWGEVILDQAKLSARQLIQFRRLVKRSLKGNSRMQKLATCPSNLVVFGHWSFFLQAIEWVQKVY